MGWLPIETAVEAVESGRQVLLYNRVWGVKILMGGWDDHEDAWRVPGYGCPYDQPSHWHPLPEPPK